MPAKDNDGTNILSPIKTECENSIEKESSLPIFQIILPVNLINFLLEIFAPFVNTDFFYIFSISFKT